MKKKGKCGPGSVEVFRNPLLFPSSCLANAPEGKTGRRRNKREDEGHRQVFSNPDHGELFPFILSSSSPLVWLQTLSLDLVLLSLLSSSCRRRRRDRRERNVWTSNQIMKWNSPDCVFLLFVWRFHHDLDVQTLSLLFPRSLTTAQFSFFTLCCRLKPVE